MIWKRWHVRKPMDPRTKKLVIPYHSYLETRKSVPLFLDLAYSDIYGCNNTYHKGSITGLKSQQSPKGEVQSVTNKISCTSLQYSAFNVAALGVRRALNISVVG